MSLLLDSLFNSVALGHFMVDMLNGQRAVLLAYLSGPLGMTNEMLALYSTIYVVSGSLTQPVFGWLSDRVGARWVAAGGVLWMGTAYILALITPGTASLWLLVMASVGSAAFHPAGASQATLRGRTHMAGKETTSAAYFFLYGQAGLFLGPFLAGPLLQRFGLPGLLGVAVLSLPVGINASMQLRRAVPQEAAGGGAGAGAGHADGSRRRREWLLPLLLIASVGGLQAWSQQNMVTFLPKFLNDEGVTPAVYGVIAATFMGGSAIGNTLGGQLADRFGKIRVVVAGLALASLPLLLIGYTGASGWLYLLVPLAGALTGSAHSSIVVMAQRLMRGGMALATGLILGFMFSAGAVGTLLFGRLADSAGFQPVFYATALVALAAAGLGLRMKEPE